jgi:AraC-like DNA-binding protein
MSVLPQVSMPFVRLLYQFWLTQGVPKSLLDSVLRVDIDKVGQVKFGISSSQLGLLHKAVIEHTGDLSLGIKLGLFIAQQELVITKLLFSAETLQQAVQSLVDYSAVISESGHFTFEPANSDYHELKFIPYPDVSFSCHQQNMVFAATITWLDQLFPSIQESMIFQYQQDVTASSDYQLLSCQLNPANEVSLRIPTKHLADKNTKSDADLYLAAIKQVEKILIKRKERLELYTRVQTAIQQSLLQRKANQENVASLLNLSVRNLQRRLKEVGASYQGILDDSREALALDLLKNSRTPLYEIAFIVGFTEPSAFYKAFRRWTGKRPGDYRQGAELEGAELKGTATESMVSEALASDG